MSQLLDRLQSQKSVKMYQLESQLHNYRDAAHWGSKTYSTEQAAKREEASQKAYNARLRACHKVQEEAEGQTGVNAWNQIEDASLLDPEVAAILASDPDAMSAAEKAGFEFTGFDLLDSEIATPDLTIGSYAIKGEAAWSAKSECQTPEILEQYACQWQRDTGDFDDVNVTVYAPEHVAPASRFDKEAYDSKVEKVTKDRAFHDIEFVLDTKGRVRSRLPSDVRGNAQSKADRIAEAKAKIESVRARKLARMARKFG